MNILLATYWGVPNRGAAHRYIDVLKSGLESQGHRVDVLSHDPSMIKLYVNEDPGRTIRKSKIRDAVSREVQIYYDTHYEEVESWIQWRDIERYTFELAAAYLVDVREYDAVHTQDIVSTRAMSRIMPAGKPLIATIHGLLSEEMQDQGLLEETDSPRTRYLAIEEIFGVMSADVAIVPKWLKKEYRSRFRIPGRQLTTEPYILDDEERLALETIKLYEGVGQKDE
ncbi:glycosyltransferase [Paenibacillus ginsengihumi]|uniref:glycosyltransferase n=1 Tax=Paenibacillus ginsengihumi TaxID=431596 RepID=UPI000371CDD7|nr:glycosyltransferase [Paenibacillus ginsengihumi]